MVYCQLSHEKTQTIHGNDSTVSLYMKKTQTMYGNDSTVSLHTYEKPQTIHGNDSTVSLYMKKTTIHTITFLHREGADPLWSSGQTLGW